MKNLIFVLTAAFLMISCNPYSAKNKELKVQNKELKVKCDSLKKVEEYHRHIIANINYYIQTKHVILKDNGNVHYIIMLRIHQTTYSLSMSEYVKNQLNDLKIEIPVSRDFYNRVSIGTRLDDGSFKMGSLLRDGSLSKLKIEVIHKRII